MSLTAGKRTCTSTNCVITRHAQTLHTSDTSSSKASVSIAPVRDSCQQSHFATTKFTSQKCCKPL
eukprot:scaffold473706_cov24-Prasinocladus_malaysianus.AAC.1